AESDTSSSLLHHDNWVYQFKNTGNKTLHFFGDDTWIRLFPDLFNKKDGTTSFYVSDYTEVDVNVTRHIASDFAEMDWNAIVLHYLGLDHIGHLQGPASPLMRPKQKEMDEAVEMIYNIVEKQDAERIIQDGNARGTLIVLCGDHGMNEKGNHGGSSIGETSAALVFMSPKFDSRPTFKSNNNKEERPLSMGYPIVDQIDIVPTLATLFNFPIPKNSLGRVITDLYRSNYAPSIIRALQLNSYQLGQLLGKIDPEVLQAIQHPPFSSQNTTDKFSRSYVDAILLHKQFMASQSEHLAFETIQAYNKFINMAQSQLVNTASDYSLSHMAGGIFFIFLSVVGFIWWNIHLAKKEATAWMFSKYFVVFATVAYAITMFASSFVEEEHLTWSFLTQTLILLSLLQSIRELKQEFRAKWYLVSLLVVQIIVIRLSLAWDNSGLSATLLSCTGVKWHLLMFVLAAVLGYGVYDTIYGLKIQTQEQIDVYQTATIVHRLIKGVFILILSLCSLFVFIYKMRAANAATIPQVYHPLLDLEIVKPLSQTQLGKLVYNYEAAGLFVLVGLFYVTKRATLMNLDEVCDRKCSPFFRLLLHLVTPVLILLSSIDHALFFCLFYLQLCLLSAWQKEMFKQVPVPAWLIGAIIVCLSHISFFMTGHSNSIASIDLSNAYIGVEGYDTILIGVLTFFSNWYGGVWWAIAGWLLIMENTELKNETYEKNSPWWQYIISHSILFSSVLLFLSISVTILREHLFIWTVFSPKYLYQVAWNCLFHWFFQVCVGSLFVNYFFNWNISSQSDTQEDEN
ncbi:hypothetical protein K501DRAFT_289468, partial [Backusella circina FSU 941]